MFYLLVRYCYSSIECLIHLMNTLGNEDQVLSLGKPITEAGLKLIQLLLLLINNAEDWKKPGLHSISQFITKWVTIYIGDVFACGKPDNAKKELQVD